MNRFLPLVVLLSIIFLGCQKDPALPPQAPIQPDGTLMSRIDSILKAAGTLQLPDTIPLKQSEHKTDRETKSQYIDRKNCPFILRSGFYRKYKLQVQAEGTNYISSFDNSLPEDVIWPGNILLASTAQSDLPQDVSGLNRYRKPGKISLAVVNGQGGLAEISDFSKSEVYEKMNQIIAANTNGFPADIRFQANVIRSEAEVAYHMGITPDQYSKEYQQSFGNVRWKENTLKVLLQLEQTFFTMLFDDPEGGGAGLFNTSLAPEILSAYTSPGQPLGYISSVSYGRSFTIIFEEKERTYVSGQTLRNKVADFVENKKLRTDYPANPADLSGATLSRPLNGTTNIYVRQIGGKPLLLSTEVFSSPDKLQKILAESATFGPGNIGKPISYRLKYLCNLTNIPAVRKIKASYSYNDYEIEEDDNTLTLYNLQFVADPMGGRPTGGNYKHISNQSHFSVRDISWSYGPSAGSAPTTTLSILQNRWIDGKPGGYVSIPTELRTSALGVNPEGAWMKLSFIVYVRAERYSDGLFGGRSGGVNRTYERNIRWRYNARIKRWEIDPDSAPYSRDKPFAFFGISDNIDYCPVNFRLHYTFTTPHQKY